MQDLSTPQSLKQALAEIPATGADGVLAPQSGGCVRHVLSQRVHFRLDASGTPTFALDASNASSLHLLVNSTVTLATERPDHAGQELQLTGRMEPVGETMYRLHTIRAYHVSADGEKRVLDLKWARNDISGALH